MRKMKLSDIKISEAFANSIPSNKKLNECRNNWTQWNRQDRFIVVNPDNVLIDGYIQYLVLKENNVEEAEIKISNRRKKRWYRKNVEDWNVPHYRNETTAYIYGIHPRDKEKKEYVWRVPKSKKGFENNLLPGDSIIVSTKYGIRPIIVTKIEWLDECPVDFSVKKVIGKVKPDISNIDADKAKEILLAHVCCTDLNCDKCPWKSMDCSGIRTSDYIKEAVDVLLSENK